MKIKIFLPLLFSSLLICDPLRAEIKRLKVSNNSQSLIVETLDDDLLHFELSPGTSNDSATVPIYTSPMIDKTDYSGPAVYSQQGNIIETSDIKASVNPQNLCISLTDKTKNTSLSTICPLNLNQDWKGLTLKKGQIENVYGLGQQFKKLGSADGDWLSHGIREEQPQGQ